MTTAESFVGHLDRLRAAMDELGSERGRLDRWGELAGARLCRGARLLAAGNGGSAAHAQHLTAELVGRYRRERRPLSALALHAETSALTAIVNDYGADEAFARQVRAHGRRGDILICLSTSGRSENLLCAARTATTLGITVLALTGPSPNPLATAADDALCVAGRPATVQEVHQVVVHLLCEAIDGYVLGDTDDRME